MERIFTHVTWRTRTEPLDVNTRISRVFPICPSQRSTYTQRAAFRGSVKASGPVGPPSTIGSLAPAAALRSGAVGFIALLRLGSMKTFSCRLSSRSVCEASRCRGKRETRCH
ncbi:hypothetical protein EYF80_054945 [Liparis tanakae]|uniref:Uncharacterized protein n=1 Tax=Liparis tanakae TaxID=230148 RepID=A0A4Z2F2H7_9TELE|nr:hypothetical protein EYF80_054945 [Liparis tanakae]